MSAMLPAVQLGLKLGPWTPSSASVGGVASAIASLARPVPAPRAVMEALQSVKVSESDSGATSFELTFRVGRGRGDRIDDPIVSCPELAMFTRARILVSLGGLTHVLVDGVITRQQFTPSPNPGASTFTVHGDDLSALLDQVELNFPMPGLSPALRAAALMAPLTAYGVIPVVADILPPRLWTPVDVRKNVSIRGTARSVLSEMAAGIHGEFFVSPTPVEGASIGYLGPRIPLALGAALIPAGPATQWAESLVSKTLSWNVGSDSNLTSIDFSHDASQAAVKIGWFDDPMVGMLPIVAPIALEVPLSEAPTLTRNLPFAKVHIRATEFEESGTYADAYVDSVLDTNASAAETVTASGELDVARYGGVLRARGIAKLRGVGHSYDGYWAVKSVTHSFQRGEYKQQFSLARDGLGALTEKTFERMVS